MKMLPATLDMPVIRTDFSDQRAWEAMCAVIHSTERDDHDGTVAYVEFVDDPDFKGLSTAQILTLVTEDFRMNHGSLFLADEITLGSPEWPVLAIGLDGEPGSGFRVTAEKLYIVEYSLSTDSVDFCDFADGVDPDGVFRARDGYPRSR
jgi:hypothetical protein